MTDLIDIGVNLTHESFERDQADVLRAAQDAGVRRMIVTGTSVTESLRALELAEAHPAPVFYRGRPSHNASHFDDHGAMPGPGCVGTRSGSP